MTTKTAYYNDLGLRTRRGAYWMAVGFLFFALNVVTIHAALDDQSVIRTAAQFLWLVGVFLGTIWNLRRLGDMERTDSEPDEGMKLAFHCTTLMPILGYFPFLIAL